ELKAYRKSTVIWTLALTAITVLFMTIYPSFTKDVAASKLALANIPQAVRQALNLSLSDFFTIFGFFAYVLNFVLLAGAVQAMNLGTGLISKEDAGKTADFLLSKPITRSTVVTAKLAAALTVLIITNVVFIGASLGFAELVAKEAFSAKTFVLMALTLFLVQLAFLALGTFFSVALKRVKSVIAVSLPTVFAFYIIGTLGAILGNNTIRYITPFKFFDTQYIISHQGYEATYLIIEVAFIAVAVVASYLIYNRKDIRSAS
ncbi:MAG TPA: ABC transporter permease, partial [Verrucomicrobiae bacterium]|nr:ABC transporter permease [Verrucomicrobiae bacterium]